MDSQPNFLEEFSKFIWLKFFLPKTFTSARISPHYPCKLLIMMWDEHPKTISTHFVLDFSVQTLLFNWIVWSFSSPFSPHHVEGPKIGKFLFCATKVEKRSNFDLRLRVLDNFGENGQDSEDRICQEFNLA